MGKNRFRLYGVILVISFLLPMSGTVNANSTFLFNSPNKPTNTDIFMPIIFRGSISLIAQEMILIPAGEFSMGCDQAHNGQMQCIHSALPLHKVYLDAYYIDKYEITNVQYDQCVINKVCTSPSSWASPTRTNYYINPLYANYPVIYITWDMAQIYCQWAGKRLPTEAEWEKAARGADDTRAFPWGNSLPDCTLANSYDYYMQEYCVSDTNRVGSYPNGASPYGVLEMAGNISEWVNDWYADDYYNYSPYSNPPGPPDGTFKVLRGGDFRNPWDWLLVSDRRGENPDAEYPNWAFRCAKTP